MTNPNPSYTISIDMAEAQGFWHSGSDSASFRDEEQYGRFECSDPMVEAPGVDANVLAIRLLDGPVFDNGSLLWCETYVEALLLAKVHRAAGYTAVVLWDMAENPPGSGGSHCVLTSWDVNEKH